MKAARASACRVWWHTFRCRECSGQIVVRVDFALLCAMSAVYRPNLKKGLLCACWVSGCRAWSLGGRTTFSRTSSSEHKLTSQLVVGRVGDVAVDK